MTPEDRIKDLRSDATPTEAEWQEFRSAAHRSLARRRVAAMAGGLGLVAALAIGGYAVANMDTRDERGPGIAASPTASTTDQPSPHTSPSSDTPPEQLVQVWYVDQGELSLHHVPVEKSPTPAKDALTALLEGPPDSLGVISVIPPISVELRSVTIEDGIAAVTLNGALGVSSEKEHDLAYGQIVYTVSQFPTVEQVSVSWIPKRGGDERGLEDRKDYEHLLPPIVVESPIVGVEVGRTFELSGIANVFEANVSWRLIGKAERYEQLGFTTATCGSGCWGTFSTEITYEGSEDQATLQVFQSSADDGSPMNMVEIPVFFEEAE